MEMQNLFLGPERPVDYRSKFTRKKIAYRTGTTSNVNAVANASPNIIVIAIGLNIAVPPQSSRNFDIALDIIMISH